ncbi:LTA synthase family protein [Candidatus Latescibacterota bacterium]
MKSWHRFFKQIQKDFKLWLFCLVFLGLFRVIFIISFRSKMDTSSGLNEIIIAMLNGMRPDMMVAGYYVLIPFLMSVACGFVNIETIAERVRSIFGVLFLVISSLLLVISYGFFREFDDLFNEFLFEFIYDDTTAIIKTIGSEYHLVLNFTVISVSMFSGIWLLRQFLRKQFILGIKIANHIVSARRKIFVTIVIIAGLVFSIRGSLGSRPFKRSDAGITKDEFLNKSVINPYAALRFAIIEHNKITTDGGLLVFLPNGDVKKAAQFVFGGNESHDSIDNYLQSFARGPKKLPPRHIFIIVGESYDSWPLLDKYKSLGLMENLKHLAENGLFVNNFLPGSGGTMASHATIITGLPDAGVNTNYQITAKKPYPSALGETFKRLGYKTRFFYGGYATWQRVGDFTRAQGFDEIYHAAHISKWSSANEWGADDEYLFRFIEETVTDHTPSLNLVLTTTYHPPYDVDLESRGFPLKKIPEDIVPYWDETTNLRILGHLWYSDKCIGDFVKTMENKVEHPLFLITGDHFGRKFINSRPDFYEKSSVPFVLYGKEVLQGITLPEGAAGSHIDIMPTLVELTAPKGFKYFSLGKDILTPHEQFLGVGRGKIISSDYILELSNTPKFHPLPWKKLPDNLPDVMMLKKFHDSLHGIAWRQIKHGSAL